MRGVIKRGMILIVSVAIAMGVALAVVAGAMKLADRLGWIEHPRTASVLASANWAEGSEKSCVLQGGMEAPTLVCDEGAAAQRMRVEFRGPLRAQEWRCARSGEWIECRKK